MLAVSSLQHLLKSTCLGLYEDLHESKRRGFITFPVEDFHFLGLSGCCTQLLILSSALVTQGGPARGQLAFSRSQSSPSFTPPEWLVSAFISSLLYLSSLGSYQATLNFGIRSSTLGNPQIRNSSQFLPPLLSLFTFPKVFLLLISSYLFLLPTFAFRPLKEEAEMENQRGRVSKAGLSLGNSLLHELVAVPSLPRWCWELRRLAGPLSPCQCSFPTRPVLINEAQQGSTDLEAGTPGLAAAPR